MKILKNIFVSKKIFFLFLIIVLIYSFINVKIFKYNSRYKNGDQIIQGKVISYKYKDDKTTLTIKAKEKIIVYFKGKINVKIGDMVNANGTVNDFTNNTVPNTFNYKKYLYNQKIYKSISTKSIDVIKSSKNPFIKVKNYVYEKCLKNKYLLLFIMGDKTMLEKEYYDSYKNIGVAHLLAVSGMHISSFVLILSFFLRKVRFKNLIISAFLIFYAYLVSFSPSVLRVVTFYLLGLFFKKNAIEISNFYRLCWTAVILLFINPFFIVNIGFLFSITSCLGIILCENFINNNYFKGLIKTTFIVSLFILPITLSLNYEINLLSFFANFLLIPLVSFVIYPFSLITFIFPFLLKPFEILTTIFEKIALILNNIQIFIVNIPKLPVILIIIYYILLFLYIRRYQKRYVLLIIFLLFMWKMIYPLSFSNQVIFLDVKQGDSSLIITNKQKNITMIDTGGIRNLDVLSNTITYLKSIGISHITNLILTHSDFDHMGEAINLVNIFKVDNVIFNCGKFNNLEQELIKVLNKKKINYYSCVKELNIGNNNELYFLNNNDYGNENDNSIVLYTKLNNKKFLFMGDASIKTEKDILENFDLSDIDVIKVGHHGSKTSTSEDFIDRINPKYSVISVGKNNKYNHPNNEVLNVLNKTKIYRTDIDGSIMFNFKNNKSNMSTCSP